MKLSTRLKSLRQDLGLTQEGFGALKLASTPGWIKIENGQRAPSEKLLGKIAEHYADARKLSKPKAAAMLDDLLTLKYLNDPSPFLRKAMAQYAGTKPNAAALLAPEADVKPARGRPKPVKG